MEISIKKFYELNIDELFNIARARARVFALEQNVKVDDLDEADKISHHVMLWNDGELISYCRILPKGVMFDEVALSRVITAKEYRGNNLGLKVIKSAVDFIRFELDEPVIKIASQKRVQGFYEKLGFEKCSDVYIKADIEHINMIKIF